MGVESVEQYKYLGTILDNKYPSCGEMRQRSGPV